MIKIKTVVGTLPRYFLGLLLTSIVSLSISTAHAYLGSQSTSTNNPTSTTLIFFNEWLDLETGDVVFCTGGCTFVDFTFDYDSSQINPVRLNKRADLAVAFVDGTPFEEVDFTSASGLTFSFGSNGNPFDNDDTIVVRLANGDLYKIGRPQCFLGDASFHTACVEQAGAFEVGFEWVQLVPDSDQDGVDNTNDNCQNLSNPDQLDFDADGFGNACDGDLNNDCVVNFIDVSALTTVFLCADNTPECQNADLDGSGSVNFIDYAMLTSMFLESPGPSAQENACSLPVVIDEPLTMFATKSYDLDTATQGGTSQSNMDIVFASTITTGFLRAQRGANIGFWGSDRPSPEECLGTPMTLGRVNFDENNVQVGDWFCARTNNGRISRFQLTAADQLPSANQIEVDLTTWKCDECETAYDPTPLPGVVGWFDADDVDAFELNGSAVVDWQDRSGNIEFMGNADIGQRPAYTPNGINGRGSVSFDGVDDRLFSDKTVSLANGYTVFIAARNDVRQNYNGLLSLRNAAAIGQQAAFEVYWQAGTTDSASGNIVVAANRNTSSFSFMESHDAGPMFGTAYTVAARVSADISVKQIRVDGDDQTLVNGGSSSDLTPNDQSRQLCIGQGFGANVGGTILEGDIGEVLVFDRALTDVEFEFVSSYIDNKWGAN